MREISNIVQENVVITISKKINAGVMGLQTYYRNTKIGIAYRR